MDPYFCPEPFVPLEPLLQPEYNFSMDTSEGLADLFGYDLVNFWTNLLTSIRLINLRVVTIIFGLVIPIHIKWFSSAQ